MDSQFDIPILFLVFNRPRKTQQVFDRIKSIKPLKLYIASDGPRNNRPDDTINCAAVNEIVRKIDWVCETKYLYRTENLGCSKAIVSAIDWFFEQEESGIILEDDCLPDPSFFQYCRELLSRYKDHSQIMMISGSNMGHSFEGDSYCFSNYGQIWGWATWKRAWKLYEREIDINNPPLYFLSKKEKKFWKRNFKTIVWDVQWAVYSIRKHKGYAILPQINLVSNIGFDNDGTIYKDKGNKNANIFAGIINFPLQHPPVIRTNDDYDFNIFKQNYYQSFLKRIMKKIKIL